TDRRRNTSFTGGHGSDRGGRVFARASRFGTILQAHEAPCAGRGLLLGRADVVGARGPLDDADPARGVPRDVALRRVPVAPGGGADAAVGPARAAGGGGRVRARPVSLESRALRVPAEPEGPGPLSRPALADGVGRPLQGR